MEHNIQSDATIMATAILESWLERVHDGDRYEDTYYCQYCDCKSRSVWADCNEQESAAVIASLKHEKTCPVLVAMRVCGRE